MFCASLHQRMLGVTITLRALNAAMIGETKTLAITGSQTPEDLQELGPCMTVAMRRPQGETPETGLIAIVDTGSGVSCISPRLAPRLGGEPDGTRNEAHAFGKEENKPTFRYELTYPDGRQVEGTFTVHDQLMEPYDVLIGRDLLADASLTINFDTGRWFIIFKSGT
jgi:hypothetical protein